MKQWLFLGAALAAASLAHAGTFTCGGVGVGDQDRMKAESAQHDMMLTFATPSGAYVADVDVRIADAKGNVVVQGHCGGPLMLADVGGKGSYTVSASFGGKEIRKSVSVGGKATNVSFIWPAS